MLGAFWSRLFQFSHQALPTRYSDCSKEEKGPQNKESLLKADAICDSPKAMRVWLQCGLVLAK